MKQIKHSDFKSILAYFILIIVAIFSISPLIWQLSTSLKTLPDIMRNSTSLLPEKLTFENYKLVLTTVGFPRYISNSLVVSIFSTIISLILSVFCSYAIVRFFPRIAKKLVKIIVVCYLFPPILMVVPYFVLLSKLRLTNSLGGLIIVYLSFIIPYCTWMLTGYFYSIPSSIEEAARIDGASRWQVFWKIVIPLTLPGIIATAIFAFINAWNEFLYSLVIISSGNKKTVSVALYSLSGGDTIRYGEMMAASVLVVLPSIILFYLIQKRLVSGLTGGAIK